MNKKFFRTMFGRSLTTTFSYNPTINIITNTSTGYEAWRLVDISPLDRATCDVSIDITYTIVSDVGLTGTFCSVSYALMNDGVTIPTLGDRTIIDSVTNGASVTNVYTMIIPPGKYLYIQLVMNIVDGAIDQAKIDTSLTSGTIVSPCAGINTGVLNTVWNENIGII